MAIDSLGQNAPNVQLQFTENDIDNLLEVLKLGFKAALETPHSAYHDGFYNAVKNLILSGLKCLQSKQSTEFKGFLHAVKILESIPVIILIENDSPLVSAFSTAANKLRHLDENITLALKNFSTDKSKNNTTKG